MIPKPSAALKISSNWKRRWEVESSITSDKMYIVAMDDEGNFKCECPYFKFSNGRVPCKHIIHVIKMLNTRELK